MNHQEYLDVPIDKLLLGFNEPTSNYITWDTYLDSWKKVDKGETRPRHLPLFLSLSKLYSSMSIERRKKEQELLGLDSSHGNRLTCAWIEKHIELYKSIKDNGYKPELRKTPLSVNITDRGKFKVADGNHTISILKHLGYKGTVKVKVNNRDLEWIKLKQQLYDMYGKKLLYQRINHPDFDDWIIDRDEHYRFKAISEALGDISGKTLLDVGSNMGMISMGFVNMGAIVTGIDPNQTRVNASEIFSDYHGFPPDNPYFECSSFETHLSENHYDVVLVLSLLHHYLRRGIDEFAKAVKLLSETCDVMVLEMGLNRLPIEWSAKLVLLNSNYTKYRIIYNGERPIYLYEK